MLFDDNEDTENKTPSVRPNDILDIEISSIIVAKTTSWLQGFDNSKKKSKSPTCNINTTKKQKRSKRSKNSVTTPKPQAGGMKRGDPFLPSVMTDENPIAEYSTKKTITKKPSDCKCKGMGYNCSPSAVLPEEMRQQWGCGMFGKATPLRTGGCTTSAESTTMTRPIAPCGGMMENNTAIPKTSFCVSNCSFSVTSNPMPSLNRPQTICWECKSYPCLCFSTGQKSEAVYFPSENDDRRKKIMNKGCCFKGKANKTRLLINTSTSQPTVKRITCFNKENNIISTSNFSKDNASHFSSTTSDDSGYYYESKYNPTAFKSSIKNRSDSYRSKVFLTSHDFNSTAPRVLNDENSYTPVSRYRHRVRSNRRSATSIPSSAITTANGPYGDARMFEPTHQRLPFSSKQQQMYMGDPQACYCERCERRVQLLSKMEALGFPSSSTHPKPSPYLHQPHQRYNPPSIPPFSSHPSNRFVPYTPYSYTYPNVPDAGSFTSPEISSSIDDDDSLMSNGGDNNIFQSLLSQANPTDPFSYLDTDQLLDSPVSSSGAIIDDIMDLSVKDTVDFFMGLKSPLADTFPLSSDNAETDVENEALCCNVDDNTFSLGSGLSLPMSQGNGEDGNHFLSALSPQNQRFGSSGYADLQTAPMSQIYSSLISDLEDELKCAIENIPIE